MQLTISGLILIPIFLAIIFYVSKKKITPEHSLFQKITIYSSIVYAFAVIYLTFFPFQMQFGEYGNQTPWQSRINYAPMIDLSAIPNLIMLAPLAVYYYLMKENSSLLKAIRLGFSVTFMIELLQFLSNYFLGGWRGADVADLVANTLGVAIGYLIVDRVFKNADKVAQIHQFKLYN